MKRNEDCIEPGVIDVLIPNFLDKAISPFSSPPPIPTHSYSINHYDSQRAIFVNHKESFSLDNGRHLSHDGAQEVFKVYVHNSKPVKVQKFMEFRLGDITKHEQGGQKHLLPTNLKRNEGLWCQGTMKQKADAILETTRFPLHLLDTQVEVLCKYAQRNHLQSQQSTSDLHMSKKRKRTDFSTLDVDETQLELYTRYLSILDPDQQAMDPHPTPMFLGQGNSITTTLSLREIFYQTFDSTGTLQVYIAQQSLLSCRHLATKSRSSILCSLDGRLQFSNELQKDRQDIPLAALTPYVRAPSYLLSSNMAQILEVNLWFSPLPCCTNYHYDSNHNLLMVFSGTKTIELAPPDVIRPAALYSEHANHPALLYKSTAKSSSSNSWTMAPLDECVETRTRLLQKSFVVSVSAGEAVYIPAGWWHRVESSDFCMAINIWFDSPSLSVMSLQHGDNSHMMPFIIREFTRIYFEQQKKNIAQHLMESDKLVWIDRLIHEYDVEPKCIPKFEKQLNASSQDMSKLNTFLSSENLTLPLLSIKINLLLLLLDPDYVEHRSLAMNILDSVYDICCVHCFSFEELILAMESSSCYNISMVWETHEEKKIVQQSCSLLFERCHENSNISVRHVVRGTEEFKRRIMAWLCQTMTIT